jgi:hypothetical protein
MLSSASYDASGDLTASREGGMAWQTVVPDSLGEKLFSGACQTSNRG